MVVRSNAAMRWEHGPRSRGGRQVAGWAILATFFFPLHCVPVFAGNDDFFKNAVVPILRQHCIACHHHASAAGEFSVEDAGSFFRDGHVEPGDPEASYLLELIASQGGARPAMPKQGPVLTAEQVDVMRKWIADGARWSEGVSIRPPGPGNFDGWSFRPLERPDIPGVDAAREDWIRTPIDRFVAAKQAEHGLSPSPDADRRTLIRRLSYDLTGLPPSWEEIRDFEASDSIEEEYLRQVGQMLDSPRYGEHWARHWLDVARYADTCGYDKDKPRPNAWPYRDYVIRSFNEDKPWARFVQEQVAGDVLFPGEPDGIIGLGFLAAGPWDFIGHVEVPESKIDGQIARNLDRDELVSATINAFCSMTIQCARCHDHKFDPFTQEHYYGLQSVFAAVDRADRVYAPDAEAESRRGEILQRQKELLAMIEAAERELKERAGQPLLDLEQEISGIQAAAPGDAPDERLASLREKRQLLRIEALGKEQSDELDARKAEFDRLKADLAQLPAGPMVYAAAIEFPAEGSFHPTHGVPRRVHVLDRGEVTAPREESRPGAIPLSEDDVVVFELPDLGDEGIRRAALARWLTREDHPLLWRSMANRVWQHYFGTGIVATPNDFGWMGAAPTHPELLDWLACELRDSGGSLKHLHRLIVSSAVYRQSSAVRPEAERVDAANRWLWRMNRRRLSAEEIRDSMLTASGKLDLTAGGPGYSLFEMEKVEHSPHFEYEKFDHRDPRSWRRTIYRFVVRSQPDPLMTTLDCADSSQSAPVRSETQTSLQALALLNNRFTLVMAEALSERLQQVEAESLDGDATIPRVRMAMRWLVGREPDPDETEWMADYARKHSLADLARILFNLSEFLYVD